MAPTFVVRTFFVRVRVGIERKNGFLLAGGFCANCHWKKGVVVSVSRRKIYRSPLALSLSDIDHWQQGIGARIRSEIEIRKINGK
jgi:hypothetical protein